MNGFSQTLAAAAHNRPSSSGTRSLQARSKIKPQKTACSGKDSTQSVKYKTPLDYAADGSGLVPGEAKMRCGNDDCGLRHIDREHGDGTTGKRSDHAWSNTVQKHLPVAGWEEFMVFSYEAILGTPSHSSYAEENDTYRCTAPIKVIVEVRSSEPTIH